MSRTTRKIRRRCARKRRQPQSPRTLVLENLEQRRLLTGPAVEGLDPLANSHTAPLETDVSAIYDQDIHPASVSDATFAVHSMQSGKLLAPPNTLSVNGSTITLDPAADFNPGEMVQASATTGIENLSGQAATAPYVWQFRTEVLGGSGVFADSGQSLTSTPSVALGDLDGDADLDAFLGEAVWLNDGQGHFSDSGQLPDNGYCSASLGDLDGDGDLDAFVAIGVLDHPRPNKVWLNDGQGYFSNSGQSLGNSVSNAVALGDVDGDGDLDAFVANGYVNAEPNKVWLNDGQGRFSDSGQSLGNYGSANVALGDVDGDGDLDAFVTNTVPQGPRVPNKVWLNDGQGRFSDSGQNLGSSLGEDVDLGDLDGDGDLDAFVTNIDDPDMVWLNDGQGHFSDSGQRLGGNGSTYALALGDVDGDGDLDAFRGYLNDTTVWLNDGQGRFSNSGQSLDSGCGCVGLGDLDGDGDLDAVLARLFWHQPGPSPNMVYLNQNPQADLAIAKTDAQVVAMPGGPLSYTVTVANNGPADVTGAAVTDVFPWQLTGVTWTATASPGSSCTPSGTGDIYDTVDLLAGGTITYTATGTLDPAATGTPTNQATVATPPGYEDPAPENNTATDTDTLILPATGGTGVFSDSGQRLGELMSKGIMLGDLDGDGDPDAFVANAAVDSPFRAPNTVWLNDGQGNFSDTGQSLGNSVSRAAALGDVDGDGDLDAFVGNAEANIVWLNDGQGHFSDSGQSLGDSYSVAVALGDLDGDGDLDAFVGNDGADAVWLNDGQGHFSDSGQSLGNSYSMAVALGDLDGDGDLDAFLGNVEPHSEVWFNDGQGHFTNSGQSLGMFAIGVALGDLDGDGDLDAFVAHSAPGSQPNRVWLNNGLGYFSDSGQSLGNSNSSSVALGDLDGDGDLDAFIGESGSNTVWLNDGQSGFSDSGQSLGTSVTYGVALGDLDGDGDLDTLTGNSGPNQVWLNQEPQADLAIAKSDGQVVAMPGGPQTYTITVTNNGPANVTGATVTDTFPVQLTDVTWTATASPGSSCTPSGTGDIYDTVDLLVGGTITYTATGTVDGAATGTPTNRATVSVPAGYEDPSPENNTASDTDTLILPAAGGSGVFTDSGEHPDDGISTAIALGDLDGDGDPDAFVGNIAGPNKVCLNDGQGRFSDSGQNLGGLETDAVALGDVDGDGDLDALVGNGRYSNGPNEVWLNDGQGRFSDTGQRLGNSASRGVALGDLDGDGDLDAFFANAGWDVGQPNEVWLNDGQGHFIDSGQRMGNLISAYVALADLDNDGDLDAFVTNFVLQGPSVPNQVWLNDGQGTFSDSGQQLGRSLGMGCGLGDLDGDGDLDAFVANSDDPNTVWLNNGQATFQDSGQRLGGDVSSFAVALGDLDDDGDLDAWVANWSHAPEQVWLNNGQGRFADTGQRLGGGDTEAVSLADVDGDGDLDACVANYAQGDPNRVWLNQTPPEIVSVDPAANTHTAPPDTDVSATYDQDIDPASVSDGTFAVHAMQTGQLLGPENVFSVDGSTIRLNPAADFKPGELVRATATTGIHSSSGQAPTNPYVWQFRSEVTAGSGVFLDSGQALGAAWSRTAVLADLDGDGDLDAFVANVDGPNTVWLNDGQGTFSDSGQRLGSGASEGLALGDLDGDGDLDAFVGNCLEGPDPANKVWLNDGQGTFSDSGQSLGTSPTAAVALGDLDGDGDLDAFVGNGLYGTSAPNKVWLNDGQGHFSDSGQNLGNLQSRDIDLGDVDGDGDLDVFVANTTSQGPRVPDEVWLNDGQGNFSDSGQRLGSSDGQRVALADLDGDADLDAFVANLDDPDKVWLNDGQGRFTDSGQSLGGEASTYALAVGDLDGDGDLDAFVEDAVWLNDGQGHFSDSGQNFDNWACVGIALGDVDGDRDLDAFMARFGGNRNQVWLNQDPQADLAVAKTDAQVVAMPGGPLSYTVTVTNNGPASVTGATVTDLFPWQLTDIAWTATASPGSSCTPSGTGDIHDTVDLLADGTITYTATGTVDPAATGTPTNRASVSVPAGYEDPAPENNTATDTDTLILPSTGGTGVYTDSGQSLGNRMSCAVALGDLDGDADLDAFVGNLDGPDTVWLGDGQGHFTDSGQNLGGPESVAVALGDLDGDGDLDAFVGKGRYGGVPNQVWLNDGVGCFSDSGQSLGNSVSRGVALGDLDGDGDLDAFVANLGDWETSQPNKVWLNDGHGVFSDSGQSLGNSSSADVALGDLDGDGDLDAFVGNSTGRQPNEVWLNDGRGTFTDSSQRLGRYLSMGVALGDLDSDGDLDAFVANSDDPNTVWINNGQGTFSDSGQRLGGEASSFAVALGDLDGDGDLDAFVGEWSHGPNTVWLNDGQGRFSDSGQLLVGGNTESVALGDVDADGDLDACTANFYDFEPNKVWLNQNAPQVVGRHLFYNNSFFDTPTPQNPDFDDDTAIAPDITALLPGETATFENYTSYSGGINGLMVDVAELPPAAGAVDPDDYFRFQVGNDDTPAGWQDAAAPTGVTVRPDEGIDGSSRITIIWADRAIQKQWLQVTVLANTHTGLIRPDVFYFGNAIGECGNSATEAKVNATDMLAARNNQRTFIDPAPIDFDFDYNRDARVNATDMLIARNNQTHFLNALRLITVPDSKALGGGVAAIEETSAHDAVFEQAAGWESGGREPVSARLAWLYQFDEIGTRRQPSEKGGGDNVPLEKALAAYGP